MRPVDADKLLEMRFSEGLIDGNELLVSFNDVVTAIRQAPTIEGYRKASEVAREIFEEIEKMKLQKDFTSRSQDFEFGYAIALADISKLKKKYTEEGK